MRKKKMAEVRWGELDFAEVLYKIRTPPKKPHLERVELILELLSKVHDGMSRAEKMKTLTQLRNALNRYKWVFQISPTSLGMRVITSPAYDLIPAGELIRTRSGEVFSKESDEAWEQQTVRRLLEGIDFGERPRTRRCEQCGEWFYARRPDQRFDVGACRQRNNDRDPAKRVQKLVYMKDRYTEMKRLAANPKSGVGLRSSKRPSLSKFTVSRLPTSTGATNPKTERLRNPSSR